MPLPLFLGIGAAIAGAAGIGTGIHGAAKMKEVSGTMESAKRCHERKRKRRKRKVGFWKWNYENQLLSELQLGMGYWSYSRNKSIFKNKYF
ncbi:hypothetical protein [Alkalibaculum bacchi]|uniref:hypothetical protein n=1 Tax=Alkalibaculum bacchi TaxID=645887 RepID=UPI0011DFC05C|nr:hypothetical protein [Alkalibaculum bacchi]